MKTDIYSFIHKLRRNGYCLTIEDKGSGFLVKASRETPHGLTGKTLWAIHEHLDQAISQLDHDIFAVQEEVEDPIPRREELIS